MDPHSIIRRVEEYAALAGIRPETVCRAATGNPRLFPRLKKRVELVEADVERLDRHMRENPIPKECAERHANGRGDKAEVVQAPVTERAKRRASA